MQKIKIGEYTGEIPTSWDEVTLHQLIDFWNNKDKGISFVLESFSGIPAKTWNAAPVEDVTNDIMPHLKWIGEVPDFANLKCPEYVTIMGKKIKVPKDLDLKSFGQKIMFEQIVKQNINEAGDLDMVKVIPDALAIYFEPLFAEKDFDDERIEDFKVLMSRGMSGLEGYAVGSFFLMNYYGLKLSKRKNLILNLTQNNLQPELTS